MNLMQAHGGPEGVDIMAQWLELEEPLRTREPAPQWKAFLELGLRPPYLWRPRHRPRRCAARGRPARACRPWERPGDRKSTRLNSSHLVISYAVFCLKKKNITERHTYRPSGSCSPPLYRRSTSIRCGRPLCGVH